MILSFFHTLAAQIVTLYHEHPVIQSIGLVAMILTCSSYQGRTAKQIVFLQGTASIFWTLHLVLLGAVAGGFLNFVSTVRGYVYINNGQKKWASSEAWPYIFCFICVVIAASSAFFIHEGWRCILSMVAQSWACFVLRSKNARFIRYSSIGISLLWLVYDVLANSIPGTICEIINQLSLYIAIFRYRKQTV